MEYIGEQLLPGQLGHFFVLLSLVSALVACLAYFKSSCAILPSAKENWIKLARISFFTDAVSVFAVFCILFYIISHHLFEYKYAWQHSSLSLEPKYLLACFWEGQEGSFLLWTFWHCVLGLVLMRKAGNWESPVMTVISFAQICLASMIAGITIFGHKIGSDPFALLRNEIAAPIFSRADYLNYIKDGNDLNPLLQNYWMVIHPPVLFMGFASTIVPFAYAIAGLRTRKFGDWIKPALPWALFSAAVLGTGIMMGAMWAYESLTFGGYWAWDPVENASLVPWLIMVSGIHTMLVYKRTKRSLRSTYLLLLLAFLFVLYSTFLTRSGILGDTSVHAFTGLEMNGQLLFFLFIFAIPSLCLLAFRFKEIPHHSVESDFSSREFWMFIGSLVLFISAVFIIGMTSVPVFNRIVGLFAGRDKTLFKPLAIGEDAEFTYNKVQIFIAIAIGLLSAITQYLKFKKTEQTYLFKKIFGPTAIALVISTLILVFGNIRYNKHGEAYLICIWIAVASSIYAVIANLAYIRLGLRGKLNLSGASIAHAGFGLLLLGILVSSSGREILSAHSASTNLPEGEEAGQNSGENLTLIKDVKTSMGKYWVSYQGDSVSPKKPLWYYDIRFESKDGKEEFRLKPNAFVNYKGNEGLMSNPDAKHYWDHDIFTYISSLPDPVKSGDRLRPVIKQIRQGDTVQYSAGYFVLEEIKSGNNLPAFGLNREDTASVATIRVFSNTGSAYTAKPILVRAKDQSFVMPDTVAGEHLVLQLNQLKNGEAEIAFREFVQPVKYVTLKVYKAPYISLLWIGVVIMVLGLIMSMIKRFKMAQIR